MPLQWIRTYGHRIPLLVLHISGLIIRLRFADLGHFFAAKVAEWSAWRREQLRLRLLRSGYANWVRHFDLLTDKDRSSIRKCIESFGTSPGLAVLININADGVHIVATLTALARQLYPVREVFVVATKPLGDSVRRAIEEVAIPTLRIIDDPAPSLPDALNGALAALTSEYFVSVAEGEVLPEHALFLLAEALQGKDDLDLIYTDEDDLDADGRRTSPVFKPDLDAELLYGTNYLARLCLYRTSLVRRIGSFRARFAGGHEYDLALRALRETRRIRHVRHVACHRPRSLPLASPEAEMAALEDHLAASGDAGSRVERGPLPGTRRVRYAVPEPAPLVSLIVPTRDRFELLQVCIESIQEKTRYRNFEIIVVDNGSTDAKTISYLRDLEAAGRARILHRPVPFNFSALNNDGVRLARGEVIGLLNNDIEVIEPDWLTEMVSHAARPTVGVVGAKLLYPDGTVQHGGVILGMMGIAEHFHKHVPGTCPGYMGRVVLTQSLSALTAACVLVRREVYDAVGGLDERLAVAFNDVDFCLKVRRAGYTNIFAPRAVLYHHESASRGSDNVSPEKARRAQGEVELMRERWHAEIARDPFYNPNLTIESQDGDLAWPPREPYSWRVPKGVDATRSS